MTPAGWQNSKQQTLLLFTEIPINNTWTSVLFEKVKWLLNPGECETGHTEVNRKIHVTSSWYSLSLAQCHLIGKKISASVFSQGRKREIICPTFWHFRGLPKVIAPVSPSWNTNAIHYALDAWRPLRLLKKSGQHVAAPENLQYRRQRSIKLNSFCFSGKEEWNILFFLKGWPEGQVCLTCLKTWTGPVSLGHWEQKRVGLLLLLQRACGKSDRD